MVRLLILAIAIFAAFWCYNNHNNFHFSNVKNDANASMSNAKIIKTVNDKRMSDYNQTEDVMKDNQ